MAGTVVALVLALLGLVSPAPADATVLPRPALDRNSRVFIVGDSLTTGCDAAIKERYRYAGIPVTINARAGRTTDEGLGILLTSAQARQATVWVIALGTNDRLSERDFTARIAVARALAGDRPIIWVDIFRLGRDAPMNSALAKAARTDPLFWTMPFNSWVTAFPNLLVPDKIHLTKAGSKWRSALYGPTF